MASGKPGAVQGRPVLGEERNVRLRSFSGDNFSAPILRQQLVDALCLMIWQPSDPVGEPGLRVDVVKLGGGDQLY
jgi:hypothetical protein